MMGATLPLVIKSAVADEARVGGRIGLLYAINTTGAIVGALVAGFYFISEIGVARSFQIAAATNIAIALVARSRPAMRLPPAALSAPAVDEVGRRQVEGPATGGQRQLVLWTFFVSGVMSLALEIIWFRMLVVFLRPTAYAFTIMLACVLAGIALGSAIAAPLLGCGVDWIPMLAAIQGVIGFAAVLSFNMLARAQEAIDAATPWFDRLGLNTYLAPLVVSSLIAMLPTTILLGLAFPIGLTLWTGDSPSGRHQPQGRDVLFAQRARRDSRLGARRIRPAAAARHAHQPDRRRGARDALERAAGDLRTTDETDDGHRAGRGRAGAVPDRRARRGRSVRHRFERFHRSEALLWREEGAQTTVAVHDRSGNPPMRVMYLDGNHQANDSPGTRSSTIASARCR